MVNKVKVMLLYYTGTYNTRYITNRIKEKIDFALIESFEVDGKSQIISLEGYDYIGIGYPIYAFNVPNIFINYLKKLTFPSDSKYFIYKNSGETYSLNDASSNSIIKVLKKHNCLVQNEYHFMMPYNIHFRFPNDLVNEILLMDEKLIDILIYEVFENISNISKYKLKHKFISDIFKIQYIGGFVNSFFYRVNEKCSKCLLCVKNCPTENIFEESGKVKFKHKCVMCMRCSMYCPCNAISIGFLNGWKVNGKYDFSKSMVNDHKVITENTKGFFKCYVKTYNYINKRYLEIFGKTDI